MTPFTAPAVLAIAAALGSSAHAQSATYDETSRHLTLPAVQISNHRFNDVVLRLDAGEVLTERADPQTASYDENTRHLSLPSVRIGTFLVSGLVIRIDAGEVLAVGAIAPVPVPSPGGCLPTNFSIAVLSKVKWGMTLGEAVQLVGCGYDPSRTLASIVQQGRLSDQYRWYACSANTYHHFFDASVERETGKIIFAYGGNLPLLSVCP